MFCAPVLSVENLSLYGSIHFCYIHAHPTQSARLMNRRLEGWDPEMDNMLSGQMTQMLQRFAPPTSTDVAEVERTVYRQLREPQAEHLKLLGYGGFSIAVAHPRAAPRWAFKRLPPSGKSRVEQYKALIERYVALLEGQGIRVVPSSFHITPAATGGHALYIAQPVMPAETLVPNVLKRRQPAEGDEVIVGVIEAIHRGTTSKVGTDGNFANWAWVDGEPWHFDISTPFICDENGKPQLNPTLMLQPYLIFARPYLRWFVAPQLLTQYHNFRPSIREAIGLLQKENLKAWIPVAVAAANRFLDPPITVAETTEAFGADRALEDMAYQMRLAQRRLIQLCGGTYQFLMPPPPVRGEA